MSRLSSNTLRERFAWARNFLLHALLYRQNIKNNYQRRFLVNYTIHNACYTDKGLRLYVNICAQHTCPGGVSLDCLSTVFPAYWFVIEKQAIITLMISFGELPSAGVPAIVQLYRVVQLSNRNVRRTMKSMHEHDNLT